jgi:hypothetical protein
MTHLAPPRPCEAMAVGGLCFFLRRVRGGTSPPRCGRGAAARHEANLNHFPPHVDGTKTERDAIGDALEFQLSHD